MPRIDSRDFNKMGEFIVEEADARQKDRLDREKQWQEVDDQLAMDDKLLQKVRAKRTDGQGDWIPTLVLPHQSTTLEVLTADARRMMIPQGANSFDCKADMTDEALDKIEQTDLLGIEGRSVVGDNIDQEELDAICEAVIEHNRRKYDVGRVIDILNADAFKYGEFAGRIREVKGKVFSDDFRGVFGDERRFVAAVPATMRNTYPDESVAQVMGEGLMIQPSWVRVYEQRVSDIILAAAKGSTDTRRIDGGWMKRNVNNLRLDKNKKTVKVIEYEGDIVIPRSQGTVNVFNKIVTVAVGDKVEAIRFRDQKPDFRSYIHGVYHFESPKAKVGPLVKAAPLHNALSEVFNRLIAASIINVEPPISHSPDDRFYASQGIQIYPRAIWKSTEKPVVHDIGDPEKMLAVFLALLKMYEELTGVSAPRTGSQTKSHQTAFAVDQELGRGQARTVDYVGSALKGPFTNWLHMEWEILRKTMKKERIYVRKLGGYIEISGKELPDAQFEAQGAAGPLEEAQADQKRIQALTSVAGVEEIAQQLGGKPIDIDKIREEILRNGGWSDPQRFFKEPVVGDINSTGKGIPEGVNAEPALAAVT